MVWVQLAASYSEIRPVPAISALLATVDNVGHYIWRIIRETCLFAPTVIFVHEWYSALKKTDHCLCLRSMSRRRGRLHELTPCRAIQSKRCLAIKPEIERAQIVLNHSQLQVCLGLLVVLRHQSLGGPWVQAWRAREWSWLVSARQRWPKKDRHHRRIVSDRSGWPARDRTTSLETKSVHCRWRIILAIDQRWCNLHSHTRRGRSRYFKLYFKAPKAEKQPKKLNSASGHYSGIFPL